MVIDWTEIYATYKGKWVALEDDEQTVIASSDTVAGVMKAAQAKGFPLPIVMKVPRKLMTSIG